jgi:hypothetical protein
MKQKDFWKNSDETIGFAACDLCKPGEQQHEQATYQNGEITLCGEHLSELEE